MPERIYERDGLRMALARVTIELEAPLVIGGGEGDELADASCVLDANGLPTIPGTSLAGVLRHALADGADPATDKECRRLFGYQARDEGQSSLMELSWAQVHDQRGRPVPPWGTSVAGDPVLELLADGVLRDHVRIGPRGGADETGKFDELLVPAGARFTFELLVHGDQHGSDPGADLDRVLCLLRERRRRLGGRTRRGLGAFKIVDASGRSFDLRREADQRDLLRLPRRLDEVVPKGVLERLPTDALDVPGQLSVKIQLKAQDYWSFGGGRPELEEHRRKGRAERDHDRLPVTERVIAWDEAGRGRVELVHVMPASGVKGALRHRVTFHARRLRKQWADPTWAKWPEPSASSDLPATAEEEWLFGKVKDQAHRGLEDRPGRLFFSEARQRAVTYGALEHVSLDRFTQGPMDGLLFSEAALHGGGFELRIDLDTRDLTREPAHARAALRAAIEDLLEGRLALGGGGSRGHGYFSGSVDWSDDGRWIGGER